MINLKGFSTLKVKEGKSGKLYIYSTYEQTTIGPAFNNSSELEAYANKHYANDYV